MSNSRKKTKIRGITTSNSEKVDKQDASRKYRRTVKLRYEQMKKNYQILGTLQMSRLLLKMIKYMTLK